MSFTSEGMIQFLLDYWCLSKVLGRPFALAFDGQGRAGQVHTSKTITPAPSPITKPSLSRLKGRHARSGDSLEVVVRLRDLSKDVIASG